MPVKYSLCTVILLGLLLTACQPKPTQNIDIPQIEDTQTKTPKPTSTPFPTSTPEPTPTVDPRSDQDEIFKLPEGYHVETLLQAPVGDMFTVAVSETGYIYGQSFSPNNPGIFVYDPKSKQVNNIRDNAGGMDIIEGPEDAIFIRGEDGRNILLLNPDGTTEMWAKLGSKTDIIPLTFTKSNRMFGSKGSDVIEIFQDGNYEVLSEGFTDIASVGYLPDGTLIVTEFNVENGRLTRIDPNGEKTVVLRGAGDSQFYLKVNSEGRVFINNNISGFSEIDPNSGQIIKKYHFGYSGGYCRQAFGFSFLDSDHVAFASFSLGSFYIGNIDDESVNYIFGDYPVNNKISSGNENDLFALSANCDDKLGNSTAVIIKHDSEEGFKSVFKFPVDPSGQYQYINDIQVDQLGKLYVLTYNGHIGYLDPESSELRWNIFPELPFQDKISHTLAINPTSGDVFVSRGDGEIYSIDGSGNHTLYTFSYPEPMGPMNIDFSEDGKLYAIGSGKYGFYNGPVTNVYLFELDLDSETSTFINYWEHDGSTGLGFIDIDNDGYIWILSYDLGGVVRLLPGGEIENIVSSKGFGIDGKGLSVSANGDIFVSGPNGIFRIYLDADYLDADN